MKLVESAGDAYRFHRHFQFLPFMYIDVYNMGYLHFLQSLCNHDNQYFPFQIRKNNGE